MTTGRAATLLFVASRVALFGVAWAAVAFLPFNNEMGFWRGFPGVPALDGWARWDSGWYREIATAGYSFTEGRQSSVAFFPGYPLAMRALGWLTGDVLLAGIIISLVAGGLAVFLLSRWAQSRLGARATKALAVTVVCYPFSYYFGAVYGDAFYLLAAIGAFALLERDRPVLAGLAGAVASGTRLVGVAVAVGLAVRAFERRGFRVRELRARDAGVLLAPLGLVAYMVYLGVALGRPLAFLETTAAPGWNLAPGPRVWLKLEAWEVIFGSPLGLKSGRIILQAALSLGALALLPAVKRRFGWGYFAYAAVAVGLPFIGTKDFIGMGRYLLAAFPIFAVVATWLVDRRRLAICIWSGSSVMLVAFTALYALWYYIS